MNTLKEFRKLFPNKSIYQAEVRPVLSILAISDIGKNSLQVQAILQKLGQPLILTENVMRKVSSVCEKNFDIYKLNKELQIWLSNQDDAQEFWVDQELIQKYADLLWAEFLNLEASSLRSEITTDLPHLLVITNEWLKPLSTVTPYVNFINFLLQQQAYALTIETAKSVLEKFKDEEEMVLNTMV